MSAVIKIFFKFRKTEPPLPFTLPQKGNHFLTTWGNYNPFENLLKAKEHMLWNHGVGVIQTTVLEQQ